MSIIFMHFISHSHHSLLISTLSWMLRVWQRGPVVPCVYYSLATLVKANSSVKMANVGKSVQSVVSRQVKPLLSLNLSESQHRVCSLYKAWLRQLPLIHERYSIPASLGTCKKLLRSKFEQHRHVRDPRVIDLMVVKGKQDLEEAVENWAQIGHIMSKHFSEGVVEKPRDFMGKFLSGHN